MLWKSNQCDNIWQAMSRLSRSKSIYGASTHIDYPGRWIHHTHNNLPLSWYISTFSVIYLFFHTAIKPLTDKYFSENNEILTRNNRRSPAAHDFSRCRLMMAWNSSTKEPIRAQVRIMWSKSEYSMWIYSMCAIRTICCPAVRTYCIHATRRSPLISAQPHVWPKGHCQIWLNSMWIMSQYFAHPPVWLQPGWKCTVRLRAWIQ